MKIGFIEPHLRIYGGIRRIVELSNCLVDRGHDVMIYVPKAHLERPTWIEVRAGVCAIEAGFHHELDVLVFNHEPQWYLLDHFRSARLKVFYALHYGQIYQKEGSWESQRSPVDLIVANSAWTAEMIEKDIGRRSDVLLGGINPDHFRPVDVAKQYPVLAVGDRRPWKGTSVIVDACERLGVEPEFYTPKKLPQEQMAEENGKAEVFVVGSDFEGFGQPGLEALACGTPLVTTDNGGCREYAIDGETALVVPRGDPEAMAAAISRLRGDAALRERLSENGLRLVRERFSWDRSAERFEELVGEAAVTLPERNYAGATPCQARESDPVLSIVVLQWDNLPLTQRCVNSVRYHTDVPYELILVDNGSSWRARSYAGQAGDQAVLNETNLGFAAGMNCGLRVARGDFVVFVNNDTHLPERWASRLVEDFADVPTAGIVSPVFTAAGNQRVVRAEPGHTVEVYPPFGPPPSAVLWMMRTDVARDLGGFGEEYELASGEDLDLAFKVWTNDLDLVVDERVLVAHVGHATSDLLEDRGARWEQNRQIFLEKWRDRSSFTPQLLTISDEEFERRRATAAAAADWMAVAFRRRDQVKSREEKIESLKRHVKALEAREKQAASKKRELRSDVAAITAEVDLARRAVEQQKRVAERCREDLKVQVHAYRRLRNRRVVRLGLAVARVARPAFRVVRRIRKGRTQPDLR